jgi:hypothetical protein
MTADFQSKFEARDLESQHPKRKLYILIHLQPLTAATLDLDFNTTVFYHRFKIEMQIVFS